MNPEYRDVNYWLKFMTTREVAAVTGKNIKTIRWWRETNKRIPSYSAVMLLLYNGMWGLDDFEDYVDECEKLIPTYI